MNKVKQQSDKEVFVSIFLIGVLCLMLELIQVRMLSFFLGSISNFLAIPIALFGLALGSLFCHLVYKGDRHRLVQIASLLVFPITAVTFIAFFVIANKFFNEIHLVRSLQTNDMGRLLTYSVLFLPLYGVFGVLLTSYFTMYSHMIGRLYFYDLVGAGLGCLITSLLFTYSDLPPTIVVLLLLSMLLLFNTNVSHKGLIVTCAVLTFGVIQALAYTGKVFREKPNPGTLSRSLLSQGAINSGVEEAAVEWNHIARSSLLRAGTNVRNPGIGHFIIVQDDGISNVGVERYVPDIDPESYMKFLIHHSFARAIGRQPKNILVMFAGSGKDMIFLDRLSDYKANITGVELNPSVINLALNPAAFTANLRAFFSKKNIRYVVKEGRDFLNHDSGKYDLILVASNGAVHANKTGHTRKYLDTYEAVRSYLDRMTDDGMIVFSNQPIDRKTESFRALFEERKIGDFSKCLFAFGSPHGDRIRSSVVQKKPFKKDEIDKMIARVKKVEPSWRILHNPFSKGDPEFLKLVTEPPKNRNEKLVVDDRPFTNKLVLDGFKLIPEKENIRNLTYASNWIKIFTCILFAAVSLLVMFIARFAGAKEGRLPIGWLSYFFVSGISYMGVQIGLIGKVELFVGNPLYAVAVILACFLVANGIGAYLQERLGIMKGAVTLALVSAVTIVWGVLCVELLNSYLLSIPMILKVLAVAIAVMPCGIALGMYYPFGVQTLVKMGRESTVPITYGAATLSSVLGSSLAVTILPNFGFSTIIIFGAVGYVSVALVYMAAKRFSC